MKIFLLLLLFCIPASAQQKVTVKEAQGWLYFQNDQIQLGFNLNSGLFYLENKQGEKIVKEAYFQADGLQSKDSCEKRTWAVTDVRDSLGKGKVLTIRTAFEHYADILWQVSLYDDKNFLVFNMGIDNDSHRAYRLMRFFPLISTQVYPGKDNKLNYGVLDGNDGGNTTRVRDTDIFRSLNNLLVKFGDVKQPDILVAGGITYHEFEKYVRVVRKDKELQLQLLGEDPVGRLIDPGQHYLLNDKFYLCFMNDNPFEALEKYADALKRAQKIKLNYYDFPTECLWYASTWSRDTSRPPFNNSKGAVEEMSNAVRSGITKYTKVGIRLVPDAYGPDNQQGWWDDKHWAMWGDKKSTDGANYMAPYLTTESWAQAIIKMGGYPFTYMQTGRRSEDFVKLHPDWMLFNDPYRIVYNPPYLLHWWSDRLKQLWGYDFTDAGFIKHMQNVYAHLKHAGIKGIFYDYPYQTAWGFEGGFDNKYATTAWAYRNVYKLADEGLGKDAMLQERNIQYGSDVTFGLIESQRIWNDANYFEPEMVSRAGLRWYKNRVVINYDLEAKDPYNCYPKAHHDGERCMLTMCYVTGGRFLLARSFSQLSKEQIHDMSRIFPYHTRPQSARPIDAFDAGVKHPCIYDFAVDSTWHQLTFYNANPDSTQTKGNVISVDLGKSLNEGGLGLNPRKDYYIYDFWNDTFVGVLAGSGKLTQQLRSGEARMMSVHAVTDHPQFISTNRHVMQGMIDLKEYSWNRDKKILSGLCDVVEKDTYKIVIATNGYKVRFCKVSQGRYTLKTIDKETGIIELCIDVAKNAAVSWSLKF